MKKNLVIKAMAIAMATTLVGTAIITPVKASASVEASESRMYNFREINLSDKLTGAIVYTKVDLPEKARVLYEANPVEGEMVISIINHANHFAEQYYEHDGSVKSIKEAYKNAFVGGALVLYNLNFPQWAGALYNSSTYENSIDNGNAITARGWFNDFMMRGNAPRTEAVLVQYVNYLVESGKLYVSSPDGTYASTSVKSRIATKNQKSIANNNYAFGQAALKSYKTATDIAAVRYYALGFNDTSDAYAKALYGALVYLDTKATNASVSTGKDWILGQFFTFDDTRTTAINYTYYHNAVTGYTEAATRNIETVEDAIILANTLSLNNYLLNQNKEGGFVTVK